MHETLASVTDCADCHIEGRYGISALGRRIPNGQDETYFRRSKTFCGGDRARK